MKRKFLEVVIFLCSLSAAFAQQVGDEAFKIAVSNPAYEYGKGPVVLIDEAHNNFHTADGRYKVFAEVLRNDGYQVKSSRSIIDKEILKTCNVFVISNALHESNTEEWSLPTPSAFSDDEIAALHDWVNSGGSLFLIADHMPFPGAAQKLAAAFGVRFMNGFAYETEQKGGLKRRPIVFRRSDGSLLNHSITKGRAADEQIDSVATFTGQAFVVDSTFSTLLKSRSLTISLNPKTAWEFDSETNRVSVAGWSQGAVKKVGQGRIAIFGEAAMFTAQVAGANQTPVGMNAPIARQNQQFLLNILHWLSCLIDKG